MNAIKRTVVGLAEIFFLMLMVGTVVWFFFGKITVDATLEGQSLSLATVEVDGEVVCQTTPCTFRLVPSTHILIVRPRGIETLEENVHWTLAVFNLGKSLVAEFHEQPPAVTPIPSGQVLIMLSNTLDVSVGYVGVKDCVSPATSSVLPGPPPQIICTIPARSSITTHLAEDGVKPYPVVMADPK